MIRDVQPGSGSYLFTNPGSLGQKSTGSRIRKTVEYTGYHAAMPIILWTRVRVPQEMKESTNTFPSSTVKIKYKPHNNSCLQVTTNPKTFN
jgi:hypothetical protein